MLLHKSLFLILFFHFSISLIKCSTEITTTEDPLAKFTFPAPSITLPPTHNGTNPHVDEVIRKVEKSLYKRINILMGKNFKEITDGKPQYTVLSYRIRELPGTLVYTVKVKSNGGEEETFHCRIFEQAITNIVTVESIAGPKNIKEPL